MTTTKNVGRIVGVLLLVQGVGGALGNFALLGPAISPPGFLVNAAANPLLVSLSAVVGILTGAISVAVAIAALPLFRRYSEALALWFLSLSIVGLSLAVVEQNTVMSLLSVSQAYAKVTGTDAALFETLRVIVASPRNWAHYTHLLVGGATTLILFALLFRSALIPRVLAAFGLAAVVMQMIAVGMPLFGIPVVMLMLMPLGLAYLALSLWLTAKGFEERQRPLNAEPHPAM